jgi:soluble P-type ATPase
MSCPVCGGGNDTAAVDKERQRIRRALAKALKVIRRVYKTLPHGVDRVDLVIACSDLDRSTSRNRGRK